MTPPAGHTADGVRWERFSLVEQLAHVGSEVERTMRAHSVGNTERFNNALGRALSLFDLTAADPRWAGHRRREVLRAREDFCRLFFLRPNRRSSQRLGSADIFSRLVSRREKDQRADSPPRALV